MPIIKNAFKNVSRKSIGDQDSIAGLNDMRRVGALEIGTGNRAVKADESGLWLGANKFADAVFSVDMSGNMIASSATFSQYISKAGTSQALTGDFNLNDGNVKIDGANNRVLINDGTDDRVLLGKLAGKF